MISWASNRVRPVIAKCARRRYVQLRSAAEKDESLRLWVLFATVKRKQMADYLKGNPDVEKTPNRVAFVRKLLASSTSLPQRPQGVGRALRPS